MIKDSKTYINSIKELTNVIDNTKTYLITGATGLIGSCLVDALIEANCNVYALGRSIDRLEQRFGKENDKLHFIAQDVTNPITLEKHLDYVIHLASLADPKSYALYPVETMMANVIGTKNMLELAKDKKAKILISSTFEVYGKLEKDTYKEDDVGILDFNQLRSSYPESKRLSELMFNCYKDEYELEGVIARFSSIYGPTMLSNDSKAHAQFIRNALNNTDIVLKSKGEQRRTYTYVFDAVSAILTILYKGVNGEAYNIANGNAIVTIANVAQILADLRNVHVVFDLPSDIEKKGFSKPQNCILLTNKLEQLGFKPKYNVQEGMRETLKILEEIK